MMKRNYSVSKCLHLCLGFILLFCLPLKAAAESTGVENTTFQWEWQNPLPQGNGLSALWGTSSGEFFAVGKRGSIIHYDGSKWSLLDPNNTKDLNAVWGTSSQDVYAVGNYGTILHYNGTA